MHTYIVYIHSIYIYKYIWLCIYSTLSDISKSIVSVIHVLAAACSQEYYRNSLKIEFKFNYVYIKDFMHGERDSHRTQHQALEILENNYAPIIGQDMPEMLCVVFSRKDFRGGNFRCKFFTTIEISRNEIKGKDVLGSGVALKSY